jgi:hypothetical protein
MKAQVWHIGMILVLLAGVLAGCGTAASAATGADSDRAEVGSVEATSGSVLTESYEGALPISSQLALGTLLLAGAQNAVSPEQARTLLPLWQVIESGSLKSEAETGSVLGQIEKAMTPEQLASIAALELTGEDLGTWAREQSVNLGDPGEGTGRGAPPEGMTQEELEASRAARESGEGSSGPPEGKTDADREAMRSTAKASGMTRPEGAGGMGARQLPVLAGKIVEMLSSLSGG